MLNVGSVLYFAHISLNDYLIDDERYGLSRQRRSMAGRRRYPKRRDAVATLDGVPPSQQRNLNIHHLACLAGFFRCEDHQMAFERLIRAREDFGRILFRHGGNECVHQAAVAAAMTAQDAAVVFDGGVDDGLLIG